MQPRRTRIALIVALVTGLAVLGLSFVPAWLVHDRVVLGEGPRRIHTVLTAWTLQSSPILSAGVLLLVAGSVLALAQLVRISHIGPGWGLSATCVGLGLVAAGLAPVSQSGHASSVMLSADWALLIAVRSARAQRPGRSWRRHLPGGSWRPVQF